MGGWHVVCRAIEGTRDGRDRRQEPGARKDRGGGGNGEDPQEGRLSSEVKRRLNRLYDYVYGAQVSDQSLPLQPKPGSSGPQGPAVRHFVDSADQGRVPVSDDVCARTVDGPRPGQTSVQRVITRHRTQ